VGDVCAMGALGVGDVCAMGALDMASRSFSRAASCSDLASNSFS